MAETLGQMNQEELEEYARKKEEARKKGKNKKNATKIDCKCKRKWILGKADKAASGAKGWVSHTPATMH